MAGRAAQERFFREEVRREEMLSSLSAVERSLEAPRGFEGSRDLSQLAAALASWIDAADTAAGVHALNDQRACAEGALSHFNSGQLEAVQEIQRLSFEADDADSPEELAHLNARAREAVGTAIRLQIHKQRLADKIRAGGGDSE